MIVTGCKRTWGIENPTYYFLEIETFIRLIPSQSRDSLYIVFDKTGVPELSDSTDYIRIKKKLYSYSVVWIFINPNQDEIVVTESEYLREAHLHLIHYSGTAVHLSDNRYSV